MVDDFLINASHSVVGGRDGTLRNWSREKILLDGGLGEKWWFRRWDFILTEFMGLSEFRSAGP